MSGNFLLPNNALPILRPEGFSGALLILRLHGHIGSKCIVETSSDLNAWYSMSTNSAAVGGVVFKDQTLAPESVRFYRVREE